MTHGDYSYRPKWSESNRNCELRYLDVPLASAVNKHLRGAPGLSERDVDPFQNAVPCWLKTSHPPARWDRRTIAEQLGQPSDTNDWVICPDCKRSHGPCVRCDVLES